MNNSGVQLNERTGVGEFTSEALAPDSRASVLSTLHPGLLLLRAHISFFFFFSLFGSFLSSFILPFIHPTVFI